MTLFNKIQMLITGIFLLLSLASCTVVKVVDAAASTAIGVTKVAVKTTGAAVDLAIPDGDGDGDD